MKLKLLAVPFMVILCVCITATATISENNSTRRAPALTTLLASDTIKSEPTSNDTAVVKIEEAWKEWKTVENHSFGKDRGSIPMIADLKSLHPFFRDRIVQLIANCKRKGIELAVVESYRTHTKQSEYYSMGRKYTRSTGGKSKHQYGLAVDVVPVVKGIALWENVTLWKKIGVEGEKLGLRWGGRWRSPYDPAHFEWSGGLTTYQLALGALPVVPKAFATQYPCLEEDIAELKKHWEVWEEVQVAQRRNLNERHSIASSETP
jgi:hypothetical protein